MEHALNFRYGARDALIPRSAIDNEACVTRAALCSRCAAPADPNSIPLTHTLHVGDSLAPPPPLPKVHCWGAGDIAALVRCRRKWDQSGRFSCALAAADPSSDAPDAQPTPLQRGEGRSYRGGQPAHQGTRRITPANNTAHTRDPHLLDGPPATGQTTADIPAPSRGLSSPGTRRAEGCRSGSAAQRTGRSRLEAPKTSRPLCHAPPKVLRRSCQP